jgi:kumamolisin
MKYSYLKKGLAALALGLLSTTAGFAGTDKVDLGSVIGRSGDQQMTVTIALKLPDPARAEAFAQRMAKPGDPMFHQFLTPAEARKEFGPSESDVARATSILRLTGLSVERASTTTLKATGPVSMMERVFQTSLHEFTDLATSKTFHAPLSRPVVPEAIAPMVTGVFGLNTQTVAKPHLLQAPTTLGGQPIASVQATGAVTTTDRPGFLTVTDFDELYDVNPLLAKGVTGAGRTIGIATLAAFRPSDAFAYFSAVGLTVNPNRISIVEVDGGSGPVSEASGSDETTLDVEQSGGVAPGANIIVYEAPNTSQGFVDVFTTAVEQNKADSISTSFGLPEIFDTEQLGGTVTDPFDGEMVTSLQAMHEDFVLGALQGQSLFAAAGDSGAFDTNRDLPAPDFSTPLSVDYPASDSAITASGGTTIAATLRFRVPSGILTITIPTEQVWGWSYLQPLCNALGTPNPITCGIFSVGTGGGVSSEFPVQLTQLGLQGVQKTQPGQSLIDITGALQGDTPGTDLFDFPANFAGRNVPDAAFNADPETGYIIIFTEDGQTSPSELTFFGGTSFVAPQMNGMAALFEQNGGTRLGLFTVPLYVLDRTGIALAGPHPAIDVTTAGNNFFYQGAAPFSPASGVGRIDVSQFAKLLP